jgi:hypothetical protein
MLDSPTVSLTEGRGTYLGGYDYKDDPSEKKYSYRFDLFNNGAKIFSTGELICD